MPKPPRKKAASYTLVLPDSDQGQRAYAMLKDLIEEFHEDLINARIAIAWNHTWKPDVDGRCKLGELKKASDLDRELTPYDFVVLLRHEFWASVVVTDDRRRAVLDHQLAHGEVKRNKAGEPARDERDRVIYRIRKHDIEEFTRVVERHGRYTRDHEAFYAAMKRGGVQRELFDEPKPAKAAKVGATPKEQLHQVATAAGEVRPSEPHRFEAAGTKGVGKDMCKHCGSGEADTVHAVETSAPGAASGEESARMAKEARKVAKGKGRKRPEARA